MSKQSAAAENSLFFHCKSNNACPVHVNVHTTAADDAAGFPQFALTFSCRHCSFHLPAQEIEEIVVGEKGRGHEFCFSLVSQRTGTVVHLCAESYGARETMIKACLLLSGKSLSLDGCNAGPDCCWNRFAAASGGSKPAGGSVPACFCSRETPAPAPCTTDEGSTDEDIDADLADALASVDCVVDTLSVTASVAHALSSEARAQLKPETPAPRARRLEARSPAGANANAHDSLLRRGRSRDLGRALVAAVGPETDNISLSALRCDEKQLPTAERASSLAQRMLARVRGLRIDCMSFGDMADGGGHKDTPILTQAVDAAAIAMKEKLAQAGAGSTGGKSARGPRRHGGLLEPIELVELHENKKTADPTRAAKLPPPRRPAPRKPVENETCPLLPIRSAHTPEPLLRRSSPVKRHSAVFSFAGLSLAAPATQSAPATPATGGRTELSHFLSQAHACTQPTSSPNTPAVEYGHVRSNSVRGRLRRSF